MPLTANEERWAEAAAIHRQYGKNAPVFVAEQLGACAWSGYTEGVERWKQIAAKLDQIMRATEQ